MNAGLFRSPAAVLPVAALVAAGVLMALEGERAARVASGWGVLAAMLAATAYLARKHMHRRGYSPEFRMRVSIEALERAQVRLAALRRDVARGALASERAVRRASQHALAQEGVQGVLRARVRPGGPGEPAFAIATEKTFPLLHASRWMRGHLYLGLAFAILFVAHGGLAPRSPLGLALLAAGGLVALSGLAGIALWATGPAKLTRLERDLSIEEAFALEEHLTRKLEALEAELAPGEAERVRAIARSRSAASDAAASLAGLAADDPQRARLEDALVLAGQRARVRRDLAALGRARLGMHAWRIVHLPVVVLLLALVGLHLFAVWRY